GPGGAGSGEVTSVMGGESGTPAGAPGHHPPTRRLGRHVPCKDSRSLPFEATRPVPLRRTMPGGVHGRCMHERVRRRRERSGGASAAWGTGTRRYLSALPAARGAGPSSRPAESGGTGRLLVG